MNKKDLKAINLLREGLQAKELRQYLISDWTFHDNCRCVLEGIAQLHSCRERILFHSLIRNEIQTIFHWFCVVLVRIIQDIFNCDCQQKVQNKNLANGHVYWPLTVVISLKWKISRAWTIYVIFGHNCNWLPAKIKQQLFCAGSKQQSMAKE